MLGGGKTMLITIGKKGKYLGVIGVHPKESKPLKFHLVTLNRRFDGPAAPMKKLVQDEYRQTLKSLGVVENFVRINVVNAAPGATFVGAATCKDCHPKTFDKWCKTNHFKAFESLVSDSKPNTAFRRGVRDLSHDRLRVQLGLEVRKGNALPGRKPVRELPRAGVPARRPTPITPSSASCCIWTPSRPRRTALLSTATTRTTRAKFEFTKYYGKIVHKGLDVYKDPKVHHGITPKTAKPAATCGARSETISLQVLVFRLTVG